MGLGKKRILYQLAQTTLRNTSSSVLWLDTSLCFSAKLLSSGLDPLHLDNIRVWRCPTLPQFFRIVQQIIQSLELQVHLGSIN
ncbi:hypothetical protein HMI55_005162 [Coelomomyces lativittatus]|nr:hypothetical protein HMI55_005162 [Coelomomyces lativittatus]